MFWKYDDEEDKVVPREPEKPYVAPKSQEINWSYEEEEKALTVEPEEFMDSDESGAEERFESRVAVFKKEDKPVYKHHFWWFVHNCVAHPLIGIAPCKSTFDFHDWTSKKINAK